LFGKVSDPPSGNGYKFFENQRLTSILPAIFGVSCG